MTRLFLNDITESEKVIHLTGEKAHYLSSVLRCKTDDTLIVTDRAGRSFTAKISSTSRKLTVLALGDLLTQDNESLLDIVLVQGLLKGEKMDIVVQKATELGIRELIPVTTERCQVRETRRVSRWQKIAEEASRQCGRSRIPLVHEPAAFETVISAQQRSMGIICWEKEGAPFSAALKPLRGEKRIMLCIGPEGGFSEEEVTSAEARGLAVASLGRRILRAETAAMASVSIVQFVLGDLSGVP